MRKTVSVCLPARVGSSANECDENKDESEGERSKLHRAGSRMDGLEKMLTMAKNEGQHVLTRDAGIYTHFEREEKPGNNSITAHLLCALFRRSAL